MPRLASATAVFPPHVLTQDRVRAMLEPLLDGQDDLRRLLNVMDRSGVRRRHFAFPPEYYLAAKPFEERNADYVEAGRKLAGEAVRACLERAGVAADRVDHLLVVTTTGLATPGLDALLTADLGFRPDVRRWPLFGLGCAGGAGAIIRAADLVKASPSGRALAVSVELCGQVFSPRALRPVDLVAAALFGDGAAATLVEGDACPGAGPRIVATKSELFPSTGHLMGWTFTGDGMKIVLSREVARVVATDLKPRVTEFLSAAGTDAGEVAWWILHPGGRRIVEEYARSFGLDDGRMSWTRDSLANVGNLSSASVPAILSDVMERGGAKEGDKGLLIGLGLGFAAEMLLISW